MHYKKINNARKSKEFGKIKKDMEWAAEKMKELRNKSSGFTDGKTGTEVIRGFREKSQ